MIKTKIKSRWRGQSFKVIGTLDKYYICQIGKKKYVRIHRKEVEYGDTEQNTSNERGNT